MSTNMMVFNRTAVRQNRDRAAKTLEDHDFLFVESAERLVNRLEDVNRSFITALDLGCHGGELARSIDRNVGIQTLIQADLSPSMAALAKTNEYPALACDDEALPFAEASFDLVLSNLSLHWVNDLPGALIQIRRALKPDGLLLATLFGSNTLQQLRIALHQAETDLKREFNSRISPLPDVRDLGNLMIRAGFALPVVDLDTITVSYSDPLRLLRDLRGMGENNANTGRRKNFSRRTTILRACEIYLKTFTEADGRIPATFEILTLTGWSPSQNQQKPLKPGTAQIQLADALADK